MDRLKGKVAIITGAGGYLGGATARLFAAEGCRVVCSDINAATLDSLVADIVAAGGEASAVLTDVTQEAQIADLVETAVQRYGRLDILHNNANGASGLGADLDIIDTPDAEWDWGLKINLYATIWGCRHAIPRMLETGGGSIINMASMLYRTGNDVLIATGVAKAAVVALTKYVATSHGKRGIRANVIAPGFTMSPDRVALLPQAILDVQRMTALTPHLGEAADQAYAALFLASDESKFMTGQVLEVDGGLGVLNPNMPQMAAQGLSITSFVKK
jgi:NAD(P)-dependent dehydrogenase (short-subunit alcohol dehydrogenase family)